jgi:tetratricopeptide (TPR) repeat protein
MIAFLRFLTLLGTLTMTTLSAAQSTPAFAARLDALWDFDKPALSEERFRAELAKWPPASAEAQEVRTQVARTLGLRRKFADANTLLDSVEANLGTLSTHVRVRYLLERGRTLNSSGTPQRAVPLFAEALALAERDKDEFYAVDAAHMLGIAAPAGERLGWNRKALSLAEAATDPRARGWRASLFHNLGWTYFDTGDAKTALDYWQKALTAREATGNAALIRVAKWTVGRGLRGVGRLDDAEAAQQSLAAELDRIGETDGYVYEELAEIALTRGDAKIAGRWAAKAHAALKDDPYLATNEAPRLARLDALAHGEPLTPGKP